MTRKEILLFDVKGKAFKAIATSTPISSTHSDSTTQEQRAGLPDWQLADGRHLTPLDDGKFEIVDGTKEILSTTKP